MLVKLDENLSNVHAELLRQQGHDCDRVTDEGLSGEPDEVVWQICCQEQRFFITLDLDFSDIRRFPPGTHPGILLLRSRTRSQSSVLDLLRRILAEYPLGYQRKAGRFPKNRIQESGARSQLSPEF